VTKAAEKRRCSQESGLVGGERAKKKIEPKKLDKVATGKCAEG